MKVLVLNPTSKFTRNVVRDVLYGCWCKGKRIGGGTVPPFEQLLIATILQQDGHQVTFLDAAGETLRYEQMLARARGHDVVAMTTSTMTMAEDADVLADLKAQDPQLFSVVYGSHPTFLPKSTLAYESIDAVVCREPYFALRDLLRARDGGGDDWKSCLGIGYRDNGQVVLTGDHDFVKDLDSLPFLNTDLLPPDVHYFNPLVRRLPYIAVSTSAGCPAKCTFCIAPYFRGTRVRFKSAARVVDEMAHYRSKGFREIYFRDETFTAVRARTRQVCEGVLARGLDVTWIANARIGNLDRPMLELMRRAGCHLIKFGVESGVQEILDRVKKNIRVEKTRQTFAWAREVGMETHAHMMLGMPGETPETLETTIRFAAEIEPTTVSFGICTPYPGTPLFRELVEQVPELGDGTSVNFGNLHTQDFFSERFTSVTGDTLEKAVRRAYRRFYLRPSYMVRSLARVRSGDDVKRFALAGTRVLDFIFRGE